MRRTAYPLIALGAAVTVTAAALPGAAATRPGGAPVALSGPSPFASCDADHGGDAIDLNTEVEPWLVVNPRDPRNMVTAWQQDRRARGNSRGVVVASTRDGGRTWDRSVLEGFSICSGGTTQKAGGPFAAFGPDGVAYVSAPSLENPGESAIQVARSADGGRTWSEPSVVVTHDITAFWDDKPSITAHPRRPGVVYAVWNRRNMTSGEHETMLAVSTDGARSWGEERVVHRSDWPEQGALGNQIVVLPGGTLLNVFLENEFPIGGPPWPTENRDERLRVIRSSDGGENWSEPVTISTHKLNDPVLPDDGRAVSANGILPEIAVDPRTGFVHVVWAENGLSESASAIGMSSSPDGGRTWSEPRRVDRTPESGRGGNGQAILPQVDVAPNGTIAITYYDFRENTPEAGTPTSLWMTTCRGWWCAWTSHGWRERKLAGPFDLEKATTWDGQPLLGGYYGLANTGSSFVSAFVATSDDPENKQDVYFTRTPASPGR